MRSPLPKFHRPSLPAADEVTVELRRVEIDARYRSRGRLGIALVVLVVMGGQKRLAQIAEIREQIFVRGRVVKDRFRVVGRQRRVVAVVGGGR